MPYEISDPLNAHYWDKLWQAHIVTEVDDTLQEKKKEEERKGERKEIGEGEGSKGGWRWKREKECQYVQNGYR